MLTFLPGPLQGTITVFLFLINTIFWVALLFCVSIVSFILPAREWRRFWSELSITVANSWIRGNTGILWITQKLEWDIQLPPDLSMNDWYLVISNHQSWVDILVLQQIFRNRIPFLKFFLKKELIWVPLLGIAWWVLDFPFMKRYSRELLERKPHLKGKDIEITRRACEKYRDTPVSIMNFVEGSRFTGKKQDHQGSPYRHLLKPRAGGIAFVLSSMNDLITGIVNVTIIYPDGKRNFLEFLSGKVKRIIVRAELIPITDSHRGDYVNDPVFGADFQEWLNRLWTEKDALIEKELTSEHQGRR